MSTVTADRAETPLALAIDIGTSSVRTVVFDRLGRTVEGVEAHQALNIRTTTEGASEVDAEVVLELVCHCLDEVLVQAGPLASEIAGVATCTFVNNILGVDEARQAITPLTTYADTRAEAEVTWLRANFDERVVHDRTGCHFHSSYLPARLRWLAHRQPELFGQVASWVSIAEYMELRLFGDVAVSYSVASWTGLLDRNRLVWDEPLLTALSIRGGQLSPLTDLGIPRSGLLPAYASRWPALQDVPWFPAVGDGAAANVGCGCVSPYRVALTMGTSTAMRAIVPGPLEHVPPGLWCYKVDGRRSLLGGALSEGGNVFAWMNSTLKLGNLATVEESLALSEPDDHGITVLPFLAGERSPGWAGDARATMHGLSLATTPLHILRAGLEAVAYRIGMVFDLMRHLLPTETQVVANGRALLSSATWLQIMADVLGQPVAVAEIQEVSARGAALLALEALGILADPERTPDFIHTVYQPDLRRHALYRAAMERQRGLYDKLVHHETRKRDALIHT